MPNETVTIAQIEAAINAWSRRAPPTHANGYSVCREARKLADVYGAMIHDRVSSVERASLTDDQRAALDGAHQ